MNVLPAGANSLLLELSPFQKGSALQESKQEVTKITSLVKKQQKQPVVSSSLNFITDNTILTNTTDCIKY